MPPQIQQTVIDSKPKKKFGFLILIICVAVVIVGSFSVAGRAPDNFVPGTIIHIPQASSIKETGSLLYNAHVIRSASIFELIIETIYHNKPVIAGDFQFDAPVDVLAVADRMTGGVFGSAQVKITIPEGSSVVEIARIVTKNIPDWNGSEFVKIAKPKEGYLFPATYNVFKKETPEALLLKLNKQYQIKIASLRNDIIASSKTESQIIIMASLLEKEARNANEAKIISGILWKRIEKDMPLQVDAPFLYILGKTSSELTSKDLQKDGPYNTYTRKGLPIGPIGNPGIAMIIAAIHPEPSPYLYYLHDSQGKVYYAKTYEDHLINKRNYLK